MSFYRFARAVVLSVFKVVFRVRVVGKENVPADRRVHRRAVAPVDPRRPVLRVHHQAHDPLPRQGRAVRQPRSASWLFTALGAVQVERGTADRAALRALEAELARGEPVAVFPEGTRERARGSATVFDGAAYLAVKLGVPIVPVGVGGSEHILPEGQVLPASAPRGRGRGEADRAAGVGGPRPPRRGHEGHRRARRRAPTRLHRRAPDLGVTASRDHRVSVVDSTEPRHAYASGRS